MGKASKRKRNLTGAVSLAKNKQIEPLSPTIGAETGLLHKPVFHILLIITLGLLAYSNTFNAPFHFDDIPNIVENPLIKSFNYFTYLLSDFETKIVFKQRIVGYFSFALNYKIHGFDVTGYHVFNISVHIINALLMYRLVLLIFETPFFITEHRNSSYTALIALFSALLFVCHPLQTQAVTYIVQRFASLAAMFYLISLVLYMKWRLANQKAEIRRQEAEDRNKTKNPESGISKLKPVFYYLSSLTSAVLAMKTKEIAFTLPVIVVLYEFMFLKGKVIKRVLYLIPFLITMLIIPVNFISMDRPIDELISDVGEATRVQSNISRLDYLFTEMRVVTTYIRLLLAPINQMLDYNYPLYHSLFDFKVFLSFLFLLSIFSIAVYFTYRFSTTHKGLRLTAFGIFWFFITLSVESSLIPIRDVIFEHRVYLPSIGIFFVISSVVFNVARKFNGKGQKAAVILFAVVVLVFAGATYARNKVWKDEISLWKDVVNKSPENERAHTFFGIASQSQGLIEQAIEQYQIAIKLNPDYWYAYNNLGRAYQAQGLIEQAIEQYQIAIKLNPDYSAAHNNLGIAYQAQGLIEQAIEQYQIAIKLDPGYSITRSNLAGLYLSQGLIEKAIEQYQTAVRLNPALMEAHNNLGIAYQSQGLIDKAIEQHQIAIKLNPDYSMAYYCLGSAYTSIDLFDKAIENYKTAIRLNLEWEMPHFKLGQIYYFAKKDIKEARKEFKKVLQINPRHSEAQKFLNLIVQGTHSINPSELRPVK